MEMNSKFLFLLLALFSHSWALSTCDSCKMSITRILSTDAEQLKATASSMCSSMSNEEDCRLIMEKFDVIYSKLTPFLPRACDRFCEESSSANALWTLLSDDEAGMREALKDLVLVEEFLQNLVCKSSGIFEKTCKKAMEKTIRGISENMDEPEHKKPQQRMSCFECELAVDTLIEEFINKREGTAADVREMVCSKVFEAWKPGCNDFLGMYLPTFLFMSYNQLDGRGVCTAMKTCEKKAALMEATEKSELVQRFFSSNAPQLAEASSEFFIGMVCNKLPTKTQQMCIDVTRKATRIFFANAAQNKLIY